MAIIDETLEQTAVRILADRAVALARRDPRHQEQVSEDGGETLTVLEIVARGERYALETIHVKETSPLANVTPVPGAPEPWRGLVNLRGALRPVMDLGSHLGLGAHDGEATSLVVVSAGGLVVAMIVEAILSARHIARTDLRVSPGDGASAGIVQGTTADLCTVLDLPALLADPAIVVDLAS